MLHSVEILEKQNAFNLGQHFFFERYESCCKRNAS